MGHRYDSILETVGRTPVVRINHLAPEGVNLYVKVEAFNPMGSVKDRLALGVIEDAEARGELRPGQTVVEATSGNTGIGLAMVCAQKGYPLVVTMAENFSVERRKLMRFLGARVVLTPGSMRGSGMVEKARELAEEHGWWQSRQFENPANAAVHERTTAVEILDDFDDVDLDYWVTGFGTGGTLNGVSRVLRERSPRTRIIVCEPDNVAMAHSGIAQERNADGTPAASHPLFRPHVMQGWSPDFIPLIVQEVLDGERIDGFMPIDGNEAMRCSHELAAREGIFVGTTSGATFAGALEIARIAEPGSNILCMLPDTGERYLSTPLFADVAEEMTEEEWDISRSTPGFRFDVCAPSGGPTPIPEVHELDAGAVAEVDALLGPDGPPVVMFSLEWCEFCWSVRRAFAAYDIGYTSIDCDSVAYQADNRGGRIRDVLATRTGSTTLPQIFIRGEFIGGCTELLDGLRDGSVTARLAEHDVAFDASADGDPYRFLPGWLQPR